MNVSYRKLSMSNNRLTSSLINYLACRIFVETDNFWSTTKMAPVLVPPNYEAFETALYIVHVPE